VRACEPAGAPGAVADVRVSVKTAAAVRHAADSFEGLVAERRAELLNCVRLTPKREPSDGAPVQVILLEPYAPAVATSIRKARATPRLITALGHASRLHARGPTRAGRVLLSVGGLVAVGNGPQDCQPLWRRNGNDRTPAPRLDD
jgi:hypothetical protein